MDKKDMIIGGYSQYLYKYNFKDNKLQNLFK